MTGRIVGALRVTECKFIEKSFAYYDILESFLRAWVFNGI